MRTMSNKSQPKTGYRFRPIISPPAPGDFCASGPKKTIHLVKENPEGEVTTLCGRKHVDFVPVLIDKPKLGRLCETCLQSLEKRVLYLRKMKNKYLK